MKHRTTSTARTVLTSFAFLWSLLFFSLKLFFSAWPLTLFSSLLIFVLVSLFLSLFLSVAHNSYIAPVIWTSFDNRHNERFSLVAGPDCFYPGLCGSMVVNWRQVCLKGFCRCTAVRRINRTAKVTGWWRGRGRIYVCTAVYNVPTKPNPDPSTTSFALRI